MNEIEKKLQKQTGVKQSSFDSEKQRLYCYCETVKKVLNSLVHQVEVADMTNEQFFLDFLDFINATSVKY